MELEDYLDSINPIARKSYFGLHEALKYVEEHLNGQVDLMTELVSFREILVEEDKNTPEINVILGSKYFEEYSYQKRLAICCNILRVVH